MFRNQSKTNYNSSIILQPEFDPAKGGLGFWALENARNQTTRNTSSSNSGRQTSTASVRDSTERQGRTSQTQTKTQSNQSTAPQRKGFGSGFVLSDTQHPSITSNWRREQAKRMEKLGITQKFTSNKSFSDNNDDERTAFLKGFNSIYEDEYKPFSWAKENSTIPNKSPTSKQKLNSAHATGREASEQDDAFLKGFNIIYEDDEANVPEAQKPQKIHYIADDDDTPIYGVNTDKVFKSLRDNKHLNTASNALTAASLIPGLDTFADMAAIPVDLLRGDYKSAAFDAIGILPFVGEIGDTAKAAKMGANILGDLSDAAKTANTNGLIQTHKLTKSKRQFAQLMDDIRSNGIRESIKYIDYNGDKYVVDGHHRLQIARILGIENIPIEKVTLPYKGYHTVNDLFWRE